MNQRLGRGKRPFHSADDPVGVKGIAAKRPADIKRQDIACVA